MSTLLKPLLTALFTGLVLSRATRAFNNHGHHNDLATFFNKRKELLSWIFMGFLSGKICEESTPNLSFAVISIAFVGCGVLLDGMFFASQEASTRPPVSDLPGGNQHETAVGTADAAECREIIKTGTPPTYPKNTLSALEARARPNQRLKLAFGIESCFTSSDEKACKSFRTQVEKLLYVEESEWVNFADTARDTAKEALDVDGGTTSLFRVVQLVTLKTMMRVLWPERDPKQSTNEQISTLAHEVNLQWLRSKKCNTDDNPSWLFNKQTSLRDAVKAVFPDWDEMDSESNPCNLILPGYETMWRVVLRCFVELKARNHDEAFTWRNVITSFSTEPTKQQLDAPEARYATEIAGIHVAKEALRLYPPTRRIYREYLGDGGQKINVSADIEAMQRDPVTWQDDPNMFVPERWVGLEEGYDKGYMPFGASPFNCPAKRYKNVPMSFGPSMVALLVGTLVETTHSWKIHGDLPEKSHPLDTDREAYSAAVLRKTTNN